MRQHPSRIKSSWSKAKDLGFALGTPETLSHGGKILHLASLHSG